ncbi:MAG: UDP-N-acetylmuramoyl-tripeptide--D-alanyl-D-alanine ligase [Minisyncoccia bacterium]
MDSPTLYALFSENGHSLSTDTRTIKPGDIYLGLRGEQFDGNAYAQAALEKGACFAVIDNPKYKADERYILVENTLATLQALAKLHREQFSIPVLAIGGSNGKTTTKELIHAVLSAKYRVHTTKGNLNNEIGVPLTILSMSSDTDIAVVEIGANHAREHTVLMDILSPTHVLVTNNGADHLEGFGSLAGVRSANKEIFDTAKTAHAFVNKDLTELVEDSSTLQRTLYPTLSWRSASNIYAGINYGETSITSSLFGSFNEPNILAAIAVGDFFSVPIESIQTAIQEYTPTLKRSQVLVHDDHTIIMDCYNANPTSMELSLKDFFHTTSPGARVIVVGDMFEVGDAEAMAHSNVLEFIAKEKGVADIVICVGPRFSKNSALFPFTFFESAAQAKPFYGALSLHNKTVFLKASRGIRLEEML